MKQKNDVYDQWERIPLDETDELDYENHFVLALQRESRPYREISNDLTEEQILMALATLPKTDAYVIQSHFGIGVPSRDYSSIADDLGVSRERVQYIEGRALRKLRHPDRLETITKYTQEGVRYETEN